MHIFGYKNISISIEVCFKKRIIEIFISGTKMMESFISNFANIEI